MPGKILVVSPTPSHPQNAGNRTRIYHMLRHLKSLGREIHFVLDGREFSSPHVRRKMDKRAMRRAWDRVVILRSFNSCIPAVIYRLYKFLKLRFLWVMWSFINAVNYFRHGLVWITWKCVINPLNFSRGVLTGLLWKFVLNPLNFLKSKLMWVMWKVIINPLNFMKVFLVRVGWRCVHIFNLIRWRIFVPAHSFIKWKMLINPFNFLKWRFYDFFNFLHDRVVSFSEYLFPRTCPVTYRRFKDWFPCGHEVFYLPWRFPKKEMRPSVQSAATPLSPGEVDNNDRVVETDCGQKEVNTILSEILPGSELDRPEEAPPSQIDEWYPQGLDRVLKKLHRKHKYDAVLVEYAYMSRAFLNFGEEVKKVLDTHDRFTDRTERHQRYGIKETFFSTTLKEEKKALDRADVVIAIQDEEREFFSSLTDREVVTVGHLPGPAVVEFKETRTNALLFSGANNPGNVHAVEYFLREILPLIRRAVPDVRFVVSGQVCAGIMESDCIKLGELPDVGRAYEMADIVVNPAPVGTGLKIKSIEALAFGKPLVATPHAATGLEMYEGEALFIGDTPQHFAQAVIRLLGDEDLRMRMGRNALVCARNYSVVNELKLAHIF